jgi:carboxypeptidase D
VEAYEDSEFVVNGSAIPDVAFDVGESYAGLLPISQKADEESQLYFWFFPSENPLADDEILIWLNGGVSEFRPPKVESC